MKKLTLFIVVLFLGLNVFAQDVIIRKSPNGAINCKIIEIDDDEIKYSMEINGQIGNFSIDKDNVEAIKYENGDVENFNTKKQVKTDFSKDAKNAIKFNFLSPLFGYTYLSYERAIKPGVSFEIGLGAIGLGGDLDEIKPLGGVMKLGVKLRRSPSYNILAGGYFMPEIVFGMYEFDDMQNVPTQNGSVIIHSFQPVREKTATLGVLATFGYSVVIRESFVIEWYGSVGYGFTKHSGLNFGFLGAGQKFPIAVATGFKFGFVF
jgi:hypothetical protein